MLHSNLDAWDKVAAPLLGFGAYMATGSMIAGLVRPLNPELFLFLHMAAKAIVMYTSSPSSRAWAC